MFEDFIGYQGSAVLDEPVREEDSFSKESMSQESEISENILLPDGQIYAEKFTSACLICKVFYGKMKAQ